jgi:hypothetical protein
MKSSQITHGGWSRVLLDWHLQLFSVGKQYAPNEQQRHIVHYLNRGVVITFYFGFVMQIIFLYFKLWNIAVLMMPTFLWIGLCLLSNYMGYFAAAKVFFMLMHYYGFLHYYYWTKGYIFGGYKEWVFYASSLGGLFGISVKDDRRLLVFSCVTIGLIRLFTDDILSMFDGFSVYIGMPTPVTTDFIGNLHNCFLIGALTIIIASFGLLHFENSIVIRRLEKEINEKNKIERELQMTTENAVKLAQAKAKYLTTMSHE